MSRRPTKRSAAYKTKAHEEVVNHLARWAADKPFYEELRLEMGKLIMNGNCPIMPDGRPNLDCVYWHCVFELFNDNRGRYCELKGN
jgi:hypothetical protein